jgi:asparagine synthetase B (glutamine-hydrolysing)
VDRLQRRGLQPWGLRAELEAKGHRFKSRTDTEAILHLYEEEGPDCVRRLEGMFALAVWDGGAASFSWLAIGSA